MNRFATLIGVMLLTVGSATPVAAARSFPIVFSAFGTATIDGCEGGDPPCAETTVVSFSGTVSGRPSPFSEIKGFRSGTAAVSGTLQIWNDSHDPDTGCYMTMLGTLVASVGRNDREAFGLALRGVFCPGAGAGTFEVDAGTTELSLFRGASGSGTFQMRHGFADLSTRSSSAADVSFDGSITVRR